MKSKYTIIILLVVILSLTVVFVLKKGIFEKGNGENEEAVFSGQEEAGAIVITAKQWSFEPAEIRVKKGDKVVLIIKNVDVKHGFSLPAFGIDEKLEPGKETRIEFKADKAGSFPFRCSVFCGQGHSDMAGTLIVEE